MSVQNVKQQPKGSDYGILIYDIPKENEALYYRIQTKIRKKAIRLNLSVYLLLWGMRKEVEVIIEEAQAETGQYASVFFAKFDNSEEAHIRRAAKESLIVEMKRIAKRLVDNVRKAREKAEKEGKEFKHISEGYAYKIKHKLEEAEALAMLFGLTRDVKYALESTQKMFAAELEKILAEKKEKKAAKEARKEAKKEEKKAKRKADRRAKRGLPPETPEEETPDENEAEEEDAKSEEPSVEMDDELDTEEVEENPDVDDQTKDEEEPESSGGGSWTDPV